MNKITSLTSQNLVAQNIETLKQLFPTIVKEGQIDFAELQSLLGEEIVDKDEYYRFTWAGKSQARLEANKPSTATLRPDKESSKNWDTTKNIFIEGDNLEVLKLLQKSYANRIKMIYIDPPYNTGKDFVYKDNYADNLQNYLDITGQTDAQGKKNSTNTESDGRYHSNWLNMMYPRLRLARNLLTDDGVIFISIDDNEVHNLRKLCDEVFGEENFVANVIWERAYSPINLKKHFSESHDFLLCYAKRLNNLENFGLKRSSDANARYSNPDNDLRGVWKSSDLSVGPPIQENIYEIVTPSGRKVMPPSGRSWVLNKSRFQEFLIDNRIWFGSNGDSVPSTKRFLSETKQSITPMTIWKYSEVGHSQEASQQLKKLFDNKDYFDYPKPVGLLKRTLELYSNGDNLILDFFAGSGTTAHAVMQLNAEDCGNRQCISVQLPEPTEESSEAFKAGYINIAEITKERIRRAGEKIVNAEKENLQKAEAELSAENAKAIKDENLIEELASKIQNLRSKIQNLDIGFKAFKLDSSNIHAWDGNPENLEQQLDLYAQNIKEDRTENDILFEVLLKYGLDLTVPIEEKTIVGNTVYNVGAGTMFVCLSDSITPAVSEEIGKWKEELQPAVSRVIFKDSGFGTDKDKTNAIQILKRFGVEEVNSI